MMTKGEALEHFKNLPLEVMITVDSDEVSAKMIKINQAYNIDISALIIFVIVGEIGLNNIDAYLMSEFDFDAEKAKVVKREMVELIFDPLIRRINFLSANPDKEMTLHEEGQILKDLFLRSIIAELKINPIIIFSVNARIFFNLSHDLAVKKVLEQALMANQEKIGHLSVANWLKDFISLKGADLFDNIALTGYVMHSQNCQKLNDDDRRLIGKLLALYRNLKFFPESMPNDIGEGWEIIPTDSEVHELERQPLSIPKTEEERKIEALQAEMKKHQGDKLEKKVIEEEIEKAKKLEGLKIMANRYAVGTLERKAIEDEIRKLN